MTDDLRALSLGDLRAQRSQLQDDDDRVSYVRRAAQARLDLVRAELDHRNAGAGERSSRDPDLSGELRRVLSQQLTAPGGGARPPREDRDDIADSPLMAELDQLCADHGFHLVGNDAGLDDAELQVLAEALEGFERRVSADRRERFELIDALGAELLRRYRDGEASVDGLLSDD